MQIQRYTLAYVPAKAALHRCVGLYAIYKRDLNLLAPCPMRGGWYRLSLKL